MPWQSYIVEPELALEPVAAAGRCCSASPSCTPAGRCRGRSDCRCGCHRAGRPAPLPLPLPDAMIQRSRPDLISIASHAALTELSRPEKPPSPATSAFDRDDRRGGAALALDADRAAAVGLGVLDRSVSEALSPPKPPGRPPPKPPKRPAEPGAVWGPHSPTAARHQELRPERSRPPGAAEAAVAAELAAKATAPPAATRAAARAAEAAGRRSPGRRPGRCRSSAWPSVSAAHTAGASEQRRQGGDRHDRAGRDSRSSSASTDRARAADPDDQRARPRQAVDRRRARPTR